MFFLIVGLYKLIIFKKRVDAKYRIIFQTIFNTFSPNTYLVPTLIIIQSDFHGFRGE